MYHIVGFLIFIPLLASLFFDNIKNSKSILSIFLFFLFIIASIRYNIGTDYHNYFVFFEKVKAFSFQNNYYTENKWFEFEPLFHYTVAILKNFISNPIFFFSFWALITLALISKGIKKISPHYMLSLFIFYCHFYSNYTFNGIGQGIVMGIFLCSLPYIISRKLFLVSFISFLSILIHKAGLLILLAYFMSLFKFKRRSFLILILLSSILIWRFGIGEKIFTSIALQFPLYFPYLKAYVEMFYYEHSIVSVIQRLFIVVPLIYYFPQLSKDEKFNKLFSIYFIGMLIYFIFGFFGPFMTRINMFFRILEVILIPILYNSLKSKQQQLVVQIIILVWSFVVLSGFYYNDAFYPFNTIFGDIF